MPDLYRSVAIGPSPTWSHAALVTSPRDRSAGNRVDVALPGVVKDPPVARHQGHAALARGRDQQTICGIAMEVARQI
jgi:hypothetical protein